MMSDVSKTSVVAVTMIITCYMVNAVESSDTVQPTCGGNFDSRQRKSGTISSPNYPHPYPADINCRYTFQGHDNERVQISFVVFDLGTIHGSENVNSRECHDVDSLRAFVSIADVVKEINVYCGNNKPPMLMSSETKLDLAFASRATPSARGFVANYNFVTDFGIKNGEQKSDESCEFTYRSEVALNGSFTSPNFPGFYPRNIQCHYLFHGKENECISITFPLFEVDGYMPRCDAESQSDFVEFSNFNIDLMDRKMSRLCGTKEHLTKKAVKSDSNFFRVTFKSNDVYDSTGFRGDYQFRQVEDPAASGRTGGTSSQGRSTAAGGRTIWRWEWFAAMVIQAGAIIFTSRLSGLHVSSWR